MPISKKNIPILKKRRIKKDVRLDALDPKLNPKVRREHLDADYLKKLPPDVLKWYAQFIDEYTHASVRKDKLGRVKRGHIHNTNALAKQCGDANNYRNNDLFSVGKANNFVHQIEPALDQRDGWYITNHELTEDALISQIDSNDQYETLTFKEYIKVRAHMIESQKKIMDMEFINEPYAYLYYFVYVNSNLNDYQLDRVLMDPMLLEKLIKNPKFFKRKKYRTDNT